MRAEVLRRDPARDREDVAARHRRLQRGRDLVRIELLPLEVALHERLVRLDDRVEELLAVLGGEVGHLVRDRAWLALLSALGARVRAHVQHVDHPGQLVLGADRDVHGDALRRELVPKRFERAEEVGALAVEHVHEDDAREAELVGELPRARRTHLDAHDRGDGHERALDDTRGAAQLALERRIAGNVDEVDLPVLPLGVLERHRDGELPLVLVLVGVRDRRARFDRAEPVDLARLEEERLDERRLSRPAVADDGDVADLCGLGHGLALLLGLVSARELSQLLQGFDASSTFPDMA